MRASPVRPTTPGRTTALAAVALAAATLLAYANSFSVPFVVDDVPSILENPSLRQLWPPWTAFSPPPELLGLPVGGRPLVNFSLALNYALGGAAPAGYHAVNLLVHILAGAVLLGVTRRTLLLPALHARFAPASLPLACALAALWLLHPLQTESVTYVCQRAESLMALCYLTTLYAFIRSVDTPAAAARWRTLSVITCLLGMACKEVMVTAPVVVWLYDRTFVAGSFAAAWRARWRFYLALAATWLLLATLVLGNLHRGGTAGFATGLTPWDYALTQTRAILLYLRLAVWPHPLVFDYGIDLTRSLIEVALPALVLLALLALTVWALRFRPILGFLAASFFLLLAPTSSIVPVATQTMAEHRMYLPLAPLVALAVAGLFHLLRRHTLLVCGALAIALGAATAHRNRTYHTALGLWSDTVAKRPLNARAHDNLGILLHGAGRVPEALSHFETALRLRPAFPEARSNLGAALLQLGRPADAALQFDAALQLKPAFPNARTNLGLALRQLGRHAEAASTFREVLRTHPQHADAHHQLAITLLETGSTSDAIPHFAATVRLRPDFAEAHSNLGVALMRAGRYADAATHYATALRLNPDFASARENLAALQIRLATPSAP